MDTRGKAMHRTWYFCLIGIFALQFSLFAQAAPSPAASAAQTGTHSAPFSTAQNTGRSINLNVVVTDKHGKPISGLSQSDFTLLDNKHPVKITSFRAIDRSGATAQSANQPEQMILVFDSVNLTHSEMTIARTGVAKFLRENGGHLILPVSVLVLNNKGIVAQIKPSTDGNALAKKIEDMDSQFRTIAGAAGFWGRAERYEVSVNLLMGLVQQAKSMSGRKLMVWIGPGWPLLDQANDQIPSKSQKQAFSRIVALSTGLREAHMTLYNVSPGIPTGTTDLYQSFLKGVKEAKKANYSDLGLQVIAVQSGGLVLGPDNDLASQLNRCVSDASVFYTLSFNPPKAARPDEYHELKIKIDKHGLKVNTNTGYYSQP